VHGAKGLEAPVVILADTMTPPAGPRPPRLLQLADGATIWVGRKADDIEKVSRARTAANSEAEHEYRRLLYVAMTRAAERLIICGADGERTRPQACWYNLVYDPLREFLVEEDDNGEKVWRFHKLEGKGVTLVPAAASAEAEKADKHELPLWLRRPAPPEPSRPALIAPSSAFDEEMTQAAQTGSAADRQKALRRGLIVHRLLQSLPDIPAAARKSAVERYLARAAPDFLATEQAEIARQVLTVLNDLVFAEVFAAGSRAEVPIIGRISPTRGAPVLVSGQIDRLAVTADSVLIADYKTDRTTPAQVARAPKPYIGQLSLYRAVLAGIYPAKTIRAALIFTGGPSVVEVPGTAMEAALAEILDERGQNTRHVTSQVTHK